MKCSVIVAFVLAGTPLRWITPYFRCVVSMISWLPSTLPVENPSQVCSAFARRVRAAVHPDDAVVAAEHAFERVGHELMGHRVEALGDAHVGPGTAHEVDARVRLRHALGQRQDRRIPVRRLLPRGVVDRQPGVVAEFRAGRAVRLVFVHARRPIAGDVHLGEGLACGQGGQQNEQGSYDHGFTSCPDPSGCAGFYMMSASRGV